MSTVDWVSYLFIIILYIMDKNNLSVVSLIVSLATLLLVAYATFFGIKSELVSLEALKVWGMENYAQVQKIYTSDQFKKTQADSLKQAVAQFEGKGAANAGQQPGDKGTTSPTPPTAKAEQKPSADGFTRGTLTSEQIATVTKDVKFEGKASAKIALVEYSDVECPFCQRHFGSKTVATVMAKYADSVKTTFKNFPLAFHATAQKAAEGILCAAKQDKMFEFKDAVFTAAMTSADKKPTIEVLLATAKLLKLDEKVFSKCLDSGETADMVKSEANEGATLFGVTGTPGNVLINTETGKYVVIAGAYPADQFDAVIAELTK